VIKTIVTARFLRIVGFAAGAVALAGSAVYITASAAGYNLGFGNSSSNNTPVPAAATDSAASKACAAFITHFATDLGVSQDKLNSAFQQALGETLADEVKNGALTQAQADAIKSKLAGKAPCTLAAGLGKNRPAGVAQYRQQLLAAAASALGISTQTLETDLKNGQTLSQIAAAQKPPVTEDQFRSRLIAGLKPMLDQAVTDKKLTSAQEQKILTALQSGPIPFWDKPMRKPAATSTPGA
jgi:hypothetical protein